MAVQNIRLYGATDITPGDIPTGVVPTRADFTRLWQGCLGNCDPPQYNPPRELGVGTGAGGSNEASAWSFGGYGSGNLLNSQSTNENIRGLIQNENRNSGWNSFLNGNAINKRLLAVVGDDLPSGTQIAYVRIWVRCGCGVKPKKYLQPYWQRIYNGEGVPDKAGSAEWPNVSSTTEWDTTTKFVCNPGSTGYDQIQSSSKWETTPLSGTWTPEMMGRLAWGVRHGRRGTEGQPSNTGDPAFHGVASLMIEVGYDAAVEYEVTTLPAVGVTGTEATLQGQVNPFGDTGGDYFFQYGTSELLGTETAHQPQPLNGDIYETSQALAGLSSDTVYYFRACATDSNGVEHYGQILTFLTVTPCSVRAGLVGG
jgi:hypothetical protein